MSTQCGRWATVVLWVLIWVVWTASSVHDFPERPDPPEPYGWGPFIVMMFIILPSIWLGYRLGKAKEAGK